MVIRQDTEHEITGQECWPPQSKIAKIGTVGFMLTPHKILVILCPSMWKDKKQPCEIRQYKIL